MPDNFASWIGLGISIVVFLGAAWVYLSGSKDKGTIATLESNNRAYAEKITLLGNDLIELRTKAAELTGRVTALEHENESLRAQRPSAERLLAIEKKLDTHDTETRRLLRAIVSGINREAGRPSDDDGT